ncbi:MAG: alpha/beta hydrolase [Planctomycetota bacterium]
MLLRIAVYAVLGFQVLLILIAWLAGRSFIYYPTVTPIQFIEGYGNRDGWSTLHTTMTDGTTLIGLRRTPAADARSAAPWIVYWGGNAAGITGNIDSLDTIRGDHDWGVECHAYRGYDGSGGAPAEAAIIADASEIITRLERDAGVPPSRLVLFGRSLGTGVAVQQAARLCDAGTPPAGVVLLSPYRSMWAMFDQATRPFPVGWAAADTWRSDAYVDRITCPVLIVHGDRDEVIPLTHGRYLAARLGDRARLVIVPGGTHNNMERAEATLAIREFIAGQSATQTAPR